MRAVSVEEKFPTFIETGIRLLSGVKPRTKIHVSGLPCVFLCPRSTPMKNCVSGGYSPKE